MRKIRTGDRVLHKPTGEIWVVAYADYASGHLASTGWPDCEVMMDTCKIVMRADDTDHKRILAELEASGDRRGKKAARIAAMEAGKP